MNLPPPPPNPSDPGLEPDLIEQKEVILSIPADVSTRELQLIDLFEQIFSEFMPENLDYLARQRILQYIAARWTTPPPPIDQSKFYLDYMEKMMKKFGGGPNIPGTDDAS